MSGKRKRKISPELRRRLDEIGGRLDARARELQELVERGRADMAARAAAGRPYASPPGPPAPPPDPR